MIKLREVLNLIHFGSKVRIIEQDKEVFPNHANNNLIYKTNDFSLDTCHQLEDYDNYQVVTFICKDNFMEIRIFNKPETLRTTKIPRKVDKNDHILDAIGLALSKPISMELSKPICTELVNLKEMK